jgi:superfamily II DNA helicase RecQ
MTSVVDDGHVDRVLRSSHTIAVVGLSRNPAKTNNSVVDCMQTGVQNPCKLARDRGVPAYIIFGDVTLRDLARKIPSTPNELLDISGIGMKKLEEYGERY